MAEGEVFRHLAPRTVSELSRNVPVEGRPNRYEDKFVYLTTKATVGPEKAKSEFKKADIAFLPLNGSICFFTKDCSSAKPMNLIGRISYALEVVEQAGPEDVIRFEFNDRRI